MRWSDWLHAQVGRTDSISLNHLAERLLQYLTAELGVDATSAGAALASDFQRAGGRPVPEFLRPHLSSHGQAKTVSPTSSRTRQDRHARIIAVSTKP